jgi:cytochrome c-type biogenesis protein
VWAPCVGPTLGAASIMAARGENLGTVALTMLPFGIGTSLPLLLLAMMSREALARWRGRMLGASAGLKMALGALLIVAGVLTLSGADRAIQTALERALPDWLVAVTTQI